VSTRILALIASCLTFLSFAQTSAQQATLCDSVIFMDPKMAQRFEVRSEFAAWIPAAAQLPPLVTRLEIRNWQELQQALQRNYPVDLRDRGIGGEPAFVVLLDTAGAIRQHRLIRPSGQPQIDRAAEKSLRVIRFVPLRIASGCAAKAIFELPISFRSM
jgi:TonB family protein